ncbi:hypothetical protein FRC03_009944 [Tulasnella sp. 419]|nr:hypothetical protein FRC03_009944 [Tulasnella sp. 419]
MSTSAGVASKRKADESLESSTVKRTKKPGIEALREELLKQATSLLDAFESKRLIRAAKNWEQMEEDRLEMIRIVKDIISNDKQYLEAVIKGIRIPLDFPDEWPQQFTTKQIDASKAIIEEVNEGAQNVAQLCETLLTSTKAAPSPSLYNQIPIWHEWQKNENAILCLRPKEKHGLPLWILADVFRQFRLMANAPLPQDTVAANVALQVAYNLCDTMGEAFLTDKERSVRFQDCIGSFFSPGQWSQHCISTKSEMYDASVDDCLLMEGIICIFREDKVELGEGHDAYLQIARDYQIYIARLRDNNDYVLLHRGAPTFLLCLIGM